MRQPPSGCEVHFPGSNLSQRLSLLYYAFCASPQFPRVFWRRPSKIDTLLAYSLGHRCSDTSKEVQPLLSGSPPGESSVRSRSGIPCTSPFKVSTSTYRSDCPHILGLSLDSRHFNSGKRRCVKLILRQGTSGSPPYLDLVPHG